jgi:hypothetical protein
MAGAPVTPLVVNGVSGGTYNQDCSPIVVGTYAAAVQAKVNGALTQTNEDGASEISGGQNGARLTNAVDIWTVQLIIDAYENVKNSVTFPATDAAPKLPLTAQPQPPE